MKINLTEQEETLLNSIVFDVHEYNKLSRKEKAAQCQRVTELAKSIWRKVPQLRRDIFSDAKYNPSGRGKSMEQIFNYNGSHGLDILCHPDFLPFLKYCIFGPSLSPEIIAEFQEVVKSCGNITSGDYAHKIKPALVDICMRHYVPRDLRNEFFRLALETGLDVDTAKMVRQYVMQRWRRY